MVSYLDLDPCQNQILAKLPVDEKRALLPHLKLVSLNVGQVLQRSGDRLDYVYFPLDCIISSLATTEEGKSVEVSVHGSEGALGIEALLSAAVSANCAVVRIPGSALQIREHRLHVVFSAGGMLHQRLIRYTLYLLRQVKQAAVCVRHHRLEQRLCRWLLMGIDHDGNNLFPMTHELLSSMLGASRPEVSLAASALRKAKLISYRRGEVSILNRSGLEAIVCDCYRLIHAEFIYLSQSSTLEATEVPPLSWHGLSVASWKGRTTCAIKWPDRRAGKQC